MMKFNIGDKVVCHSYRHAGKTGVVVDRMTSEVKGTVYTVKMDGSSRELTMQEDLLDLIVEEQKYTAEVDFEDNVVVVRICAMRNGKKTEVAKGHGHILHDGVYGFGQAVSYAAKRAFIKIEEYNK